MKMNNVISLIFFFLMSCNLSYQIIYRYGDSVLLKKVASSDTVLTEEFYKMVKVHLKNTVQCKQLKYLELGNCNFEHDSTLYLKSLDKQFFLVNSIINTPDKDQTQVLNPENEFYFMKINDIVIISRKKIFKLVFNENTLIFKNNFSSFEMNRKFFCHKLKGIKKTIAQFHLKFKIDWRNKTICVLETYFH